ncbi:putative beta-D-xylosidase 5 [Tasmannia lanceolata]|uniref:putative beta-D-xylosidase 5 n=1 Tax=Tasmannia lanceolata TaxID=3420 RepID=UPI0040639A18
MASHCFFILLLSLTLFASITDSRNLPRLFYHTKKSSPLSSSPKASQPSPIPPKYTYVCNSERFAELGLDISSFAFCDKSHSYDVRAKDLIDRMTLTEKVTQLGNKAYGVPRLGLPMYEWWSEALHGVSDVGPGTHFNATFPHATSFPTVILTTASFNESLWKAIGEVVSTEARAMYNLGYAGLTYWSPNINVVRDPRWGRITETPGEDPYIVGRYAVNYVKGLQDVAGNVTIEDLNSRPLKVSASCKHYVAYDVDNWLGIDRYHFDARVTEQDMIETFQRPFEMCVKDGDVSSVMCSYNRVNGIPACADHKLLTETIREKWDLHGYIVADCDSIEVMFHGHKWTATEQDAVAQALKAGLDLDCGIYYTNFTEPAVRSGKAREDDVDKALMNLYRVLMRLGFFDGSPAYSSLGIDDVCATTSIELAAEAAKEGIVLLKNNNSVLPLNSNKYKNLAVVGPHANATKVMIGNYALERGGTPCRYVSPIDGLSKLANVNYKMGCANVACKNETFIYAGVEAAKQADATIIFAGIDLSIEAEGLDRTDLLLPGYQTEMILEIANAATTPVVLVIFSAGGVDISFAKNHPNIVSIIWAGFPGAEGGLAIADVIFGHYNPGGRLPITWYEADYVDQLPMTSMPLRPIDKLGYPGRTYKFFNGSTVYPFGYGLSYTNFTYSVKFAERSLDKKLLPRQQCRQMNYMPDKYMPSCQAINVEDDSCDDVIEFGIEVFNAGKHDGSNVVIVYSSPPKGLLKVPIKQVVGFQRVYVLVGKSETVKFSLNVCKSLSLVDEAANTLLPSGEHTITIGDGDGAVSFPVRVNFDF